MAVFLDDRGVLVMVVVVVVHDRSVVVMLLDRRMRVLDVVMVAVAVHGHAAGPDVNVLGERADRGEGQGGGGGQGCNGELHLCLPCSRMGLKRKSRQNRSGLISRFERADWDLSLAIIEGSGSETKSPAGHAVSGPAIFHFSPPVEAGLPSAGGDIIQRSS
ncbi:protein of unknown function [Methylorubrum extorquens DM4]|uniref:Uncharacterized protein n=1 Tax=Methylorubrum extorquens (strain DSM 6343 / CIP 106787 / DM4) TaxID=661410 RepID=C7CFT1_METED|nr:protein of unknown function [Methylorubrum extorquens DM4]